VSTVARVAAVCVDAGGPVTTWRGDLTLVNVLLAKSSGEPERTVAGEVSVVHVRTASCAVLALVWETWIHLHLTRVSGIGWLADALERVDMIDADPSILARLVLTIIYVGLAVDSSKSRGAATAVAA